MLSSEYLPNPAGVSNAVARRQTSPKGEISGRQNPHENARGRKPFRAFIGQMGNPSGFQVGKIPRVWRRRGDFCAGKSHFPERKLKGVAGGAESAGFCSFAKDETATAQIENLSRSTRRGRRSPVHRLVKNFLTSWNPCS